MNRTRPCGGAQAAGRCAVALGLRVALAAALSLSAVALPALAHAQSAPRESDDDWRATRVAKWTLLAAAVALGAWSYRETALADESFDDLRRLCERDPASCTLDGGRYTSTQAERLFDATGRHDSRARVGIFAGQTIALGAAAFFIVDLRHGGSPDDIPYDPSRRAAAGPTLRLGVRLTR